MKHAQFYVPKPSTHNKTMSNKRNRIGLSPADYDFALIKLWAELTGTTPANLALVLMQRGLRKALKDKEIPAEIVSAVHAKFFSKL